MKKNLTVIKTVNDYTLLFWDGQYVVAWKYDETTQDWCQGHYFETLKEAHKCFMEKVDEDLLTPFFY